jgi:hypothetical protein
MVICRFAQVCQQCRAREDLPGLVDIRVQQHLATVEAFSIADDSLLADTQNPDKDGQGPSPTSSDASRM